MLLPSRAEDVYEKVWRPMQDLLTATQLETLVFVDLVLRGRTKIKRQDIYRAQQARLRPLEGDEAAIEAEVVELARRARFFHRIVNPAAEPDVEIGAALDRLDRWGASTTYPLLMHLYDQWDRGACGRDDVVATLGYVESFLVRRMIAGVPTNALNKVFSPLVAQLPSDATISDGVRRVLSGQRRYWPSDQRLRRAFSDQPFYFQGRQEQKMLIFQRLEESYQHAEPVDWAAAKLTIEHVMPQTLNDEWRAALAEGGDDPEVVHEELLHTLGNLTVTAYNGQLSNNPFERKQEILQGSHLELNRAISPNAGWSKAEILARADELADRAIAIWAAPMAGVEEPPGGRDWRRLHAALAALPFGAWTTYSDAAELIGSHQVPVGQHLAGTPNVMNAYRVLNVDGRISPGFRWTDPADTRDVRTVLEAEGVTFDEADRADPTQRLRAEDLAGLIGEVVEPAPGEDERDESWRLARMVRYLGHFYTAPDHRLPEDQARVLAISEGYDPRGVAGFYQGTGSLQRDGAFRVLTEVGVQLYLDNRHRLS